MASVNCDHPYNSLVSRRIMHSNNLGGAMDWEVLCVTCKERFQFFDQARAEEFVLNMYRLQTGYQDVVVRDLFGTPIEVGSHIVYPVLSGRSTAIAEGHVLEINPPTRGTDAKGSRLDAPRRLKVQPTGRTSRNWYNRYGHEKVITLSANAESAVVIP